MKMAEEMSLVNRLHVCLGHIWKCLEGPLTLHIHKNRFVKGFLMC